MLVGAPDGPLAGARRRGHAARRTAGRVRAVVLAQRRSPWSPPVSPAPTSASCWPGRARPRRRWPWTSPTTPRWCWAALLAAAPAVALTGTPALVEYATELVAGGLGKGGRGPLAVRLDDPDAPLADLVRSAGVPEGALAIEVAGPVGRCGRGAHAGHARRRRARAAHRGLGRRAGRCSGSTPSRWPRTCSASTRPSAPAVGPNRANPPATAGPRSSTASSRATSPCGAGAGCPRAPTRSSTRCARSSTRPRPRPPTWPCTPILTGRATPPPRCCGWSWPAAPG